jgi:hypothetical protein
VVEGTFLKEMSVVTWFVSTVFAGLYGIALWMLPVEKWTSTKAHVMGLLLAIPFTVVQKWVCDCGTIWPFLGVHSAYEILRVSELPKPKGLTWIDLVEIALLVGFLVVAYLQSRYGLVIPGFQSP